MPHVTLRPICLLAFAMAGLAVIASCRDSRPDSQTNAAPKTVRESVAPGTSPTYASEVQPLFDNRCIACHGCLGSPCNVKLSSFRAVDRGGFGKNPYSTHLEDSPRTGMEVVSTTTEWRERGFYPVVSRGGYGRT